MSALLAGASCCESRLPVVWSTLQLESRNVMAQFGDRPPTVRQTDTLARVLADPHMRQTLEEAGLLEQAKKLPPDSTVELLAWKARCWFMEDQYVVGLFNGYTGRVLAVDGMPLFAIRVPIS